MSVECWNWLRSQREDDACDIMKDENVYVTYMKETYRILDEEKKWTEMDEI